MAPLNLTPANIELFLARAKPFLLVWLVIRVFSSGFLGKTATAAAAAGLAFASRAMPALVPARAAEQLKKIDTLSASSNQRLLLSLSVDAVGAFLALFEPRWLRMIVGGAGWVRDFFSPLFWDRKEKSTSWAHLLYFRLSNNHKNKQGTRLYLRHPIRLLPHPGHGGKED
jgi:hypothetical protein